MSTFSELEVQFADETVFNEQSTSFTYRIPVLAVRPTFPGGRDTDRSLQNRLYKTRPGYLTSRSLARLSIDFYLPGANADVASGALPATHWAHILLKDALGGSNVAGVGGVAGASATATSLPNATGTWPRGSFVRAGQAGDGRAQGQAAVLGATPASLLTALPGVPNAADVLRPSLMAYLTESLGTSKRFLVAHADESGMQFIFSGCHAESVTFRTVMGELIVWTIDYVAAYWRPVTAATPSAATLENCNAQIVAGGQTFVANVGATTRPSSAEDQSSEVSITLNMQLTPRFGQNQGTIRHAHVLGFVRTKDPTTPAGVITIQRPWSGTPWTEFLSDGSNSIQKHILLGLNVGGGSAESEGRSVTIYTPRAYRIGDPPVRTDYQNLKFVTEMFALDEGPDETNDLTQSAFRVGLS